MNAHSFPLRTLSACLPLLLAACGGANQAPTVQAAETDSLAKAQAVHPSVKYPDHHEFEAELQVPFTSSVASGARRFSVTMSYLGAPEGEQFAYRLDLLAPGGKVVQTYSGVERYAGKPMTLDFDWAGRAGAALPDGVYEARLTAFAADADAKATGDSAEARVQSLQAAADGHGHAPHEQSFKFVMGEAPVAKMPAFRAMALGGQLNGGEAPRAKAMAAAAIASWPYTVYFGTLHGQTNDSDGGGALATCSSSQAAQTGQFGPDTAFPYAKGKGLDFLGNTDHNHYYDGSSGLGTVPANTAKTRYTNSVAVANNYTASNPGFLALHGMEWGVISNGGHLNIFNSDELYAWEYDPSNQLYGHRFVAKNDYATLYSVMRAAGQVGQFNHPDTSGQFIITASTSATPPMATRSWCWQRSPTPAPSPTSTTRASNRARATRAPSARSWSAASTSHRPPTRTTTAPTGVRPPPTARPC